MLGPFLFQSFVLYPVINYALGKKQYSVKQRLGLVFGIISLIALGVSIYTISQWDRNYFEILGVPRSANSRDIKQAYRKLSLEQHPDKNPTKEAEENFVILSKAYNTLINDEFRDAYDKWGEKGLKWVETNKSIELNGLTEFIIFIFTQVVLTYILTIGVSNTNARAYSYAFLGVITVVLASMKFGSDDIPIPFAPSMTRDQKGQLFGEVFSLFVLAIGAVQRVIYLDIEEAMISTLRQIEIQQAAILLRIGNLAGLQAPNPRGRRDAPTADAQAQIPVAPARNRSKIPDIPSWAYLLLVIGLSQYFKEKEK